MSAEVAGDTIGRKRIGRTKALFARWGASPRGNRSPVRPTTPPGDYAPIVVRRSSSVSVPMCT